MLADLPRPFDQLTLKHWIQKNLKKYHTHDIMVRIGKGDHGGGPSSGEIERIHMYAKKSQKKFNVKFSTFHELRDCLFSSHTQFSRLTYEIGNELQGDLTNCIELKQQN